MSSTPLPKRRRLGTSSSFSTASSTNALSQPFKSPFKTPLKPNSNPTVKPSPAPTTPNPTPPSFSSPSSLLTLQSQHTALLAQVSASRARLETCIQAQKLESAGSDGELAGLVRAWKGASRRAAEEVFEGWRVRVLGMGGVKAWRSGSGGGWGWDSEGKGKGRKGEGGEEGEGEEEAEEAEEAEEKVENEEGEEDEEFTMAMMLQSLGIELDVIGYDKEGQIWVD